MREIKNTQKLFINPDMQIDEVLKFMQLGQEKILVVVDEDNKLLGTITDGDIRRELISNGVNTASNAEKIMNPEPIYSNLENKNNWLNILSSNGIEHLLICDTDKKIISIFRGSLTVDKNPKEVEVLIHAGGKGLRMGKEYKNIPKPLIEVNGLTLIERNINNVINQGFNSINISLSHKSDVIAEFLNKKYQNNTFNLIFEDEPLGTAGSLLKLTEIKSNAEAILSINSDLIFKTNLSNFLNHHVELKNTITIGTARFTYQLPYGVLSDEDNKVIIDEKPLQKFNVLSGVNLIDASHLEQIQFQKLDMDELIQMTQDMEKRVGYYDLGSEWIDIGNQEKLEIAKKLVDMNLI
tara:strand:+ start:141 stop:1196 length:1056 start_codon:yes stop_codon:yes gene_type:complete